MYRVTAIQPVYWRIGRIYKKHSFFYCWVLERVYRVVAWLRVDKIRYNTKNSATEMAKIVEWAEAPTEVYRHLS
jgi:hypothetical protein